MKIRAITFGICLSSEDLESLEYTLLKKKLKFAKESLTKVSQALEALGYTIQTNRITFNSFEEWLLPYLANNSSITVESAVKQIDHLLSEMKIDFCSFGPCTTIANAPYIQRILSQSSKICVSFLVRSSSIEGTVVAPSLDSCQAAASVCVELAQSIGNLANFQYCIGFDCPANTPFFPISYHDSSMTNQAVITIGLENGDLLFLANYPATTATTATKWSSQSSNSKKNGSTISNTTNKKNMYTVASENLYNICLQAYLPIQAAVQQVCLDINNSNAVDQSRITLVYGGVDASINPGLTLQDSVGGGLEYLLLLDEERRQQAVITVAAAASATATVITANDNNNGYRGFGGMGTLAAVSAVTSALKALEKNSKWRNQLVADAAQPLQEHQQEEEGRHDLKLCGYSGLMLPVMEDLFLAARANGQFDYPPVAIKVVGVAGATGACANYTLRDLLVFSSICGVGLDTIPIPGPLSSTSSSSSTAQLIEQIANVYLEVGTIAFRLRKPLSCRLLPMIGKGTGEMTEVESPYLCNTRIFSIR